MAELASWTKQRDQILNDENNKTIVIKEVALGLIGEEALRPLLPIRIRTEPTLEGLIRLFRECYQSLGIMSSEGGQFIGGHAMREDARLRTAAGLSNAWDGNSIKRSRSGDGNYALFGRRLTMHLLVQPRAWPTSCSVIQHSPTKAC